MWNQSTLDGLDVALSDLHQAIQNLPDSSTKKQLLKRFRRLAKVRKEIDGVPQTNSSKVFWFTVGLIILILIFLFFFIKGKLKKINAS